MFAVKYNGVTMFHENNAFFAVGKAIENVSKDVKVVTIVVRGETVITLNLR